MEVTPQTVREIADELNVSPKTMRAWMRKQNWRSSVERGQAWAISAEQAARLRDRFGGSEAEEDLALDARSDPLAGSTVGELLTGYRDILGSLRARGLVRTNNAPIGDLAEYCAAIVYDGLLAPNSEKAYDLVAEDGRRIQVKVRLLRPLTSKAAVFSPIRSFGFDACVFVLVNDDAAEVEIARELSVDEVQAIGKHREHTNGVVIRMGQVRANQQLGTDLTDLFRSAWREMMGRLV